MKKSANGISSISPSPWEDTRSVAYMCPDTAGQAVFEAQSLLVLIGEYVDSENECSTVIPRSEKMQDQREIKVFPNPGSGIFTFDLGKNSQISSISLFNVDGLEVAKLNTNGHEILRFNTSELQPGVYFFTCKKDEEALQSGKLLIIR